jgi:hypothetical protein
MPSPMFRLTLDPSLTRSAAAALSLYKMPFFLSCSSLPSLDVVGQIPKAPSSPFFIHRSLLFLVSFTLVTSCYSHNFCCGFYLRGPSCHEAVVRLLLEKGASIAVKDNYRKTALHRAAETRHEAMVQLLLEKGAGG